MITIKNSGHRAVAANTPEGIKVIRPGKSASFEQEPHNVDALKGVRGVKVTGKAEEVAPDNTARNTAPASSLPAEPGPPEPTPTNAAPAAPVAVATPSQPSAAVTPAATAAGAAPVAGGKPTAKGVQPPSAPPSGG